MNKKTIINGICATVALLITFCLFIWIVGNTWTDQPVAVDALNPTDHLADIAKSAVIEQSLDLPAMNVDQVAVYPMLSAEKAQGTLTAELLQNGEVLDSVTIDYSELDSDHWLELRFAKQPLISGTQSVVLRLSLHQEDEIGFVTFGCSDQINMGKFTVAVEGGTLQVDGAACGSTLCVSASGVHHARIMLWVYLGMAAALLLSVVLTFYHARLRAQGKRNRFLFYLDEIKHFGFLLKQLIMRDFNTKYRQSMLGVLWSFLNPLLTMLVQYAVFSTLFNSSIPYFPIYLLVGITLFNYFNESVSMGLETIVINRSLLNKVYVPKYLFPVSKVLFSLINLLLTMIPILIVSLCMGIRFTRALLLLPWCLLTLTCFTIGVTFLLATSYVYFRDTKFLWSVVGLLWSYLTPLFYPESIIPARFLGVYRANPMYQFISFMRTIIIDGVSPAPSAYLWCALTGVGLLVVGFAVFKRNQKRFTLYI